jgi:hypothetical protein
MKLKSPALALGAALLCSAAPALAATPSTSRAGTPNTCIERNHGDWNACNVDNSAAGNRAYQITKAPRTPDECIKRNNGDFNACNVGNSGAGNLHYLPVTP